jgi:hypothetical protein
VIGRRKSPGAAAAVPGGRILRNDALGTGAFVVATACGVINRRWVPLTATVSALLFMIGAAAMLMAFGRAVGRSRTEAIGMGGLYFLAGDAAPAGLRRPFSVLLAVQVIVGVVGAASRVYTAMAACVLVPVFGIGMSGLWGSRFSVFPPRGGTPARPSSGPSGGTKKNKESRVDRPHGTE